MPAQPAPCPAVVRSRSRFLHEKAGDRQQSESGCRVNCSWKFPVSKPAWGEHFDFSPGIHAAPNAKAGANSFRTLAHSLKTPMYVSSQVIQPECHVAPVNIY